MYWSFVKTFLKIVIRKLSKKIVISQSSINHHISHYKKFDLDNFAIEDMVDRKVMDNNQLKEYILGDYGSTNL